MGFFSGLFKKKSTPITDDEIADILAAHEKREYASAIEAGETLLERKGTKEQRVTLQRTLGLAYFQVNDHQSALKHLEPLATATNATEDWFNLATTSIMAHKSDKGMAALTKALDTYDTENTSAPPPGFMFYFVMRVCIEVKDFSNAFQALDALKKFFCAYKVIDSTFLFQQGMPEFTTVMEQALPILQQMPEADVALWLESLEAYLDDEGKTVVQQVRHYLAKENSLPPCPCAEAPAETAPPEGEDDAQQTMARSASVTAPNENTAPAQELAPEPPQELAPEPAQELAPKPPQELAPEPAQELVPEPAQEPQHTQQQEPQHTPSATAQHEAAISPMKTYNDDVSPTGYNQLEIQTRIVSLMASPRDKRDREWLDFFFTIAADAIFEIPVKKLLQGPDGFMYYPLKVINLPDGPQNAAETLTFSGAKIRNLASACLIEGGAGVAIFGDKDDPEWVFTYGDIVNLHLHNSLMQCNGSFMTPAAAETLTPSDMTASAPPEDILPAATRKFMRQYLEQFYPNPSVALLTWKNGNLDLAVNATPDKFKDQETFQDTLQSLKWFLPRDYTLAAMADTGIPMEPL